MSSFSVEGSSANHSLHALAPYDVAGRDDQVIHLSCTTRTIAKHDAVTTFMNNPSDIGIDRQLQLGRSLKVSACPLSDGVAPDNEFDLRTLAGEISHGTVSVRLISLRSASIEVQDHRCVG